MFERAPLLPPALVATALVGAFLLGLPWGSWRFGPALTDEAPYVEIVGHYSPDRWGSSGTIGSGPGSDIRLTEADIPPQLGRFEATEAGIHYIHDTTSNNAAFYPIGTGPFARVRPVADALEPVQSGDRVLVSKEAIAEAELPSRCDTATPLQLVDATGLWLSESGEPRTWEIPAIGGTTSTSGDETLVLLESGLWRVPSAEVKNAEAVGTKINDFSGRFEKPDAYVQIGDGSPVPIGITGRSTPLDPAFHVFRRKPMSESASPWAWRIADALAWVGFESGFSPHIGRADGFTGHLYRCNEQPRPIGEQALKSGDVLLAGHTTFGLRTTENHAVEFTPTEPPAHRVHALSSVSLGRIRSVNPHWSVPTCGSGTLLFRGTTDETLLPEGVAPATPNRWLASEQSLIEVPLPAWAARHHPQIQEQGLLRVDLLEICVEHGRLRIVDDFGPPSLNLNELHGNFVVSGSSIGLAGHNLRFSAHRPWLERALPLLLFLPILFATTLVTARKLLGESVARSPEARLDRLFPIWTVAAVGALIGIGAVVQTRLATSPALLGSGDYLQRHLLTSLLASFALLAAVEIGLHARNGFIDSLHRSVKVARSGAITLTLWLLADRALWSLWGRSDADIAASVYGDLNRSLLTAIVLAALLTGLSFALGRKVVQDKIAEILENLRIRWDKLRPTDPAPDSRWAPVFAAFQATPRSALIPMGVGLALLVTGVVIGGTGRGLFGFDLKLAEFAAWPIGLALAALLVSWSRTGTSLGRFAVPIGIVLWLASVTATVVICYALRGDFGPLMVLVPAMFGGVAIWVLPWRLPGDSTSPTMRWAVLAGYASCIAMGIGLVLLFVPFLEAHFSEIPGIGTHVQRALGRVETHQETWYTQGGHWSTTANWMAAGYFEDRERYVSNLHSDLAFVAVMQSFHAVRAAGILGLFLAVIALLGAMGERLLNAAELQSLPTNVDPDEKRRMVRKRMPTLLRAGAAGYACLFASMYLGCELIVHLGTCFNTLPQTGLTLPWISAGGSASVGFAILVGAALATFVSNRKGLEDGQVH